MSDSVPASHTVPLDREQFWRDTLAAFPTAQQTVRDFCRSRGLPEKRFYTWRRKLGLSPVASPTPPVRPTPGFVPLRVVPDTLAAVELGNGLSVRVSMSADPVAVARLVAALRGASC